MSPEAVVILFGLAVNTGVLAAVYSRLADVKASVADLKARLTVLEKDNVAKASATAA